MRDISFSSPVVEALVVLDVTQRMVVDSDCLTLEVGPDRLSRGVGNELPTRCITSENIGGLNMYG